jgi:hypothetical protein
MSYTQYVNMDSTPSVYDLPNAQRTGTVDQCKTICDATANCAGFSYGTAAPYTGKCWLKRRDANTQPFRDIMGIDLYSNNLNLNPFYMDSYDNSNYAGLSSYATSNNVDLTSCDSLATEAEETQCKINLIQKHMRDNTDRKLAEIYKAQGTNTATFDENYRNTMMLGVVWAMLGTTALYYTFKNL